MTVSAPYSQDRYTGHMLKYLSNVIDFVARSICLFHVGDM